MTRKPDILLGLIGDNIAESRSPLLHRLAGEQNGCAVRYDLLVPRELGQGFDVIFDGLAGKGYRGTNVTYPYKERAAKRVTIDDPLVKAIGAINTAIFEKGPNGTVAKGYNTDYSGFMAGYARVRGDVLPGLTLMIGTGGVGRAVAFGLVALGVKALRLVDRDRAKAEVLADALRRSAPDIDITVLDDAEIAARGAAGLVNCTPVGMAGYEGTPLSRAAMTGAQWAFDAVYTPRDTQFLTDADDEDLQIVSGWELFFYQGVHAWKLFADLPVDEERLRRDLLS